MAIIQGDVIGGSAGFYPKEIEQSLRFNDDDSAYLSWTPASAGNRKTWTWSAWFKVGKLSGTQVRLLSAGSDADNRCDIGVSDDDHLYFQSEISNSRRLVQSDMVFRDPSAWYHVVAVADTTQATDSDRFKCWINGEQIAFNSILGWPSQNDDMYINSTTIHQISGYSYTSGGYTDGYLADVHFTDGTAYDATAFGEFKNGVWVAKEFTGTYGTNGFYLPFRNDYTVEGFSATTYTGTGSTQYIGGVGFEPDLVWIKNRDTLDSHVLFDSIRGATERLFSNLTNAEDTATNSLTSFESDGFMAGGHDGTNKSGSNHVAWCWDAGSGSPVSNTDGSITSTVKANPSRGFSIVSYTGTGSAATVGHGLSSAPEMIIIKNRDDGTQEFVSYHDSIGATKYLKFTTDAAITTSNTWNDTAPTSSVFSVKTAYSVNRNTYKHIAYCFHSVSGYSKMGSWTGTGSSLSVTTGFKPAFVLLKNTSDGTTSWIIFDGTRNTSDPRDLRLDPNASDAESTFSNAMDFDADGFTINSSGLSQSGATYIYMAFADTREAAFWLDDSGNNNDWENNGLTESDISLDSPTNNFATLNPLDKDASCTLSEGNLKYSAVATGYRNVRSSTFVGTGKWYAEFCPTTLTYESRVGFGIAQSDAYLTQVIGNTATSYNVYWQYTNTAITKRNNSTDTNLTSAGNLQVNDVIQIAVDFDAGKIWWGWNGTWLDSGDPSSGINPIFSGIASGDYAFMLSGYTDGAGIVNFGQDSSFAGNKVPQGYTDANGYGDFYYAPPTGYLALCTANLPEPAIGPNSASTSDEHFNTVLYTGNGSNPRSITGVGFQPDFVWVKDRSSGSVYHLRQDAVRGAAYALDHTTSAEAYQPATGYMSSFDSDGFTSDAGSSSNINFNNNGDAYVAWNWKADNTSGSTNTDGTITSTVSANVDAGFSIVSYAGNGSNATVGHGLSQAPDMMIVKNRDDGTRSWITYHKDNTSAPETDFLRLDATNATADYPVWNDTAPTSSVFSVGDASTNGSGNGIITYCFHSVEGFSKFGSYTGNKAVDGPFVYLGFKPAFIMIKSVQYVDNWFVFDSARDDDNIVTATLYPNSSSAETYQSGSSFNPVDFLSNGFKIRGDNGAINDTGAQFIYMAFAENPFKYSNAR